MNELSSEARRLIASASGGDEPNLSDQERVQRKLASRLALAAAGAGVIGAGVPQAHAAAAASKTGVVSASKFWLALVLGGTPVAVGTHHLLVTQMDPGAAPGQVSSKESKPLASARNQAHEPADVGASAEVPPVLSAPPVISARPTSSAPPVLSAPPVITRRLDSEPRATETPARRAVADGPAREVGRPEAPRSPVESSTALKTVDSITEEAALLRAARSALSRGSVGEALQSLRLHATHFPRGALIEERRAITAMAYCAAGPSDQARATATSFLKAYPHSPLVAPVKKSCAALEF